MTESLLSLILIAAVMGLPLSLYLLRMKANEARIRQALEQGAVHSEGPKAQHPQIDTTRCIGCGSCVKACPEGDVLAVYAGKAAIIHGHKCIGHGLCAEACPVDAITMTMAAPSMSANLPHLSPEFETNIPNLFIVGELGGLALIKNAVNQGRECVDSITGRIGSLRSESSNPEIADVCIVGAGPAGISASLRAIENQLHYLTLEQDEIGGTVAKYPRQKLVMTSPVVFPLYGSFRKMELSKEDLLEFWHRIGRRADFRVRTGTKVENIVKNPDGTFTVESSSGAFHALSVVLAMGGRGTPRKLGIQGEDLPQVMYSLIEAEAYTNKRILVVGGGDSAIEAALGLSLQKGNEVTLSYRKKSFQRIKARNEQRIGEFTRKGKVKVLFDSNPVEIRPGTAVIDLEGRAIELPNDFVWIFAGGSPPTAFLEKIGVKFGACNLTAAS